MLEHVGNWLLGLIAGQKKDESKSIGGLSAPTGVSGVYMLMEREIIKAA